MPTTDNVRVFPEKAGIRERGFGTQVPGRLDDSNSIVFAELLQAWHCHFTGKPNGVLPYLNRKTLALSNPDHRRRVSREWWQACETEPSDEFVRKVVSPVETLTHDCIHLLLGLPPTWMGEYHVNYVQPIVGLRLGYGMRGYPFSKEVVKTEMILSRSKFFQSLGIDKNQESWCARSLEGREGVLGAYFSAMRIGAVNIKNDRRVPEEIRQERWKFNANITDGLLQVTTGAQWRYAGLLTSLVEINRDGGNPVDVTKPWNLVTLRVPLDTLRDQMCGSFPVRPEEQQAIQEDRKEFGAEAEQFPLIDPRLLRFPPTLRNRIQAFEAEYGKESASRGDPLSPNMSLFPSITPHMDQRDAANQAIQLIRIYNDWARRQRGKEEPTRLETLAARARQAATRPPQERPPVDIAIGPTLLKQFTQLVTR